MKKIYLIFLLLVSLGTWAQVPSNDVCSNALAVALPASGSVCFNSSNANATSDGIITCDTAGPGKEVWFTFIATNANNSVTVTPNGATPLSNVVVTLIASGCGSGTYDMCNSGTGTNPVTSTLGLVPGTQVWVSVESNGLSTGDFQVCINSTPPSSSPGDGCATATNVCNKASMSYPDLSGFTASGVQPTCFAAPVRKDVWVKFTVGVTGTLEFFGTPIAADEYDWALYDVTSGCLGTLVSCNYNYASAGPFSCGIPGSTFGMAATTTGEPCPAEFNAPVTVTAGRTYALLIDNYSQTNNGFTLDWGGTFQMGTTANFTATPVSSCSVPLVVTITNSSVGASSYLWNFGDGATSTSPNPGTHTYTSTGDYLISLVVTGSGCTSVMSKRINLNAGPVIVVNPPSATICPGDSVNLNGVLSLGTPYNDRLFSNNVNAAIPNNSAPGLTNALTSTGMVNTTLTAGSVQSICFTINHTDHSDIGRGPTPTAVQVTVNGNTYNFTPLPLPVVSGTATYCFPQTVLDAINAAGGNANTTWTLKVADNRGGGGGTGSLVSWAVTLRDFNSITGYSWSPTTNMVNSATLSPTVSPTANITYTLTATDLFGCSSSFNVPITMGSLPTLTLTSLAGTTNQVVCINNPISTITYAVGGGATGASVSGLPTGVTGSYAAGVFTISGTPTVAGTFNYTVTTSGGCTPAATATGTITVNSSVVPTTGFSYSTPVCSNGSNPIPTGVVGFTTGGTYSSTAGLTINATTGEITLATSTAGTYTVTYTVPATVCGPVGSSTFAITITAVPTATISYAGTPFCTTVASAAVTLNGTGAYTGGTYASTAGLTINASTGEITPSSSTPGTYTVTYTIPATGGCAAVPVTTSVTITAAPTATISYAGTPFCTTVASAAVTLSGTGAYTGGTYTSTAGLTINASTGTITPSSSTPGIYTVTYTIPATGGCAAVPVTTSVTITAAPTATISYAGTPFCTTVASAAVTLNGTGAYTGGTFASTAGLTINASTGTITPSSSTPGIYTITYTIPATGGCAAVPVTTSVTITAAPTATISYAGTPFCTTVASAAVTLNGTGAYTGGTYASTAGLTINASTGTITPSSSTPGTYTVTYTIPAAGGCAAVPVTTSVTITAAPAATISYVGTPFCAGSGTAAVAQTGTTGGSYSSTAGLVINPTTGLVDLNTSTPGTYTVTYTIPASGGCAALPVTTTITINPTTIPVTGFSYSTPVCSNGSNPTPTGVAGFTTGGTYSSTAGLTINATTGEITLATSTAGTYTVTYTVPATVCGPVGSSTFAITITAVPTATISYAGTPFCTTVASAAVTLNGTGAYTGGTYASTAGLTINASTGTITPSSSTPGTYTVTYTIPATGGCAAVPVTTSVTITAAPTATISYAGTPFCTTVASAAVTLNGTGAYTGGTFASTAGLAINASTGEIIPSSSTPGTYTVTYTIPATGGCAAVPVTTSVTITAAPTATISYAGTPFCAGTGMATVSQIGTSGGSYSSTAGLVINTTTGEIDLNTSTPGSYTVTYEIAASGGCSLFTSTTNIVINPVTTPVTGFSYSTPVCSNGSNPLPTGVVGFTTGGTYSSTAGLTINSSTGEITLSSSIPGAYVVTYTVPASVCGPIGVSTANITITAVPTATISYAGSPYCTTVATATVTLNGTAAYAGGTYSSTSGLTINAATGDITPSLSTPGIYVVTYTIPANGGCSAVPVTTSVTITAAPTATFSYAGSPFCTTVSSGTVTLNGTGAYTGGTYTSTTGLTINAATGEITPNSSTPGTYTVTYTIPANGGCSSIPVTTTVTVSAAPSATISYAGTPFCSGTGFAAVTQTGTLGGTYSSTAGLDIDTSNGEINLGNSAPGSYVVTYTVAASGGCGVYTTTANITISQPILVTASGGCFNQSYVLSPNPIDPNYTYEWFDSSGISIGVGTTVTVSSAGVYEVHMTTEEGCVSQDTVEVLSAVCEIPKGISPNGDGYNDNWNIEGINAKSVKIFNRYGVTIYEHGSGYTDQWYGQSNSGQELPDGTYYYVIETGDGQTKTGWVYINRER